MDLNLINNIENIINYHLLIINKKIIHTFNVKNLIQIENRNHSKII